MVRKLGQLSTDKKQKLPKRNKAANKSSEQSSDFDRAKQLKKGEVNNFQNDNLDSGKWKATVVEVSGSLEQNSSFGVSFTMRKRHPKAEKHASFLE